MAFVFTDDGKKVEVHHNTKGAINEMIATVWLLKHGYDVFRNVSPRGRADLVAINWETDEGWVSVDVKSEQFDLDGLNPMNEGHRETQRKYEASNIRYLVVMDNGNCVWYDELEKINRGGVPDSHWVDPNTGQRFLHPRNDMSKSEWSYFAHWMLNSHRDKVPTSTADFLHRVSKCTQGKGFALSKRDKDWLKKVHRFIFKKVTGIDPDTNQKIAANDNSPRNEVAA